VKELQSLNSPARLQKNTSVARMSASMMKTFSSIGKQLKLSRIGSHLRPSSQSGNEMRQSNLQMCGNAHRNRLGGFLDGHDCSGGLLGFDLSVMKLEPSCLSNLDESFRTRTEQHLSTTWSASSWMVRQIWRRLRFSGLLYARMTGKIVSLCWMFPARMHLLIHSSYCPTRCLHG
jgi:hypothetical protein